MSKGSAAKKAAKERPARRHADEGPDEAFSEFARLALPVLAFVSGASALVYESLWLRSFGLVFGNTTEAVSVVLATFMGGLGLGSLATARRHFPRPLRAYALAEVGIGLTALFTLPLLTALPRVYGSAVRRFALGGPLEGGLRMLLAALLILPTTLLIGATIPLLMEALTRTRDRFRADLSRLYRLNTVGGASGVLLGAFLFLPSLGVRGTFVLAALGSLTVGALAWMWSRRISEGRPPAPVEAVRSRLPWQFAALAAASGASALGLEVLWTRSYALVIGSSVYAFNLMLFSFLLGIVGGAVLYERLGQRLADHARAVPLLFLALGLLVLLSPVVIGWLPAASLAAMRALPVTFLAHQAAAFLLCFGTMIVFTTAFGFLFPALTHFLTEKDRSAQEATGLLYAWNTLGAIVGVLLTHLLLIPRFGLQRSYGAMAGTLFVAGAATLGREAIRPALRAAVLAGVLALTCLALWRWEPWDRLVMTAGVYKHGLQWREDPAFDLAARLSAQREIVFYSEGREAVVSVTQNRETKSRFLAVNGKTDAGDGAEDVLTQKMIAHVPLMLHPRPQTVLVVGWGAGATAASARLYPLRSLDCVEIEPATYAAAPLFEALSGTVTRDPRFRILFDDGRNFLLTTHRKYDAILSEPSNPWITGVSNLFTREFYEVVSERLESDGVFCQWFHYYNLELEDVRIQVRTFLSVFPEASLWLLPPTSGPEGANLTADLLLIGSRVPQMVDGARLRRLLADAAIAGDLQKTRAITDQVSLLAMYALGREDLQRFAAEGRQTLNTDDSLAIELRAPRSNVLPRERVLELTRSIHDTLDAQGRDGLPPVRDLPGWDATGPDRAVVLRELARARWQAARAETALRLFARSLEIEPGSVVAHTGIGEILLARGRGTEAEASLHKAVEAEPGNERASDLLGSLYFGRQEYEKAAQIYAETVRVHPDQAIGFLRLGTVRAQQGRWAEARDALRGAVQRDPGLAEARQLLTTVEARIGGL